MIRFCRRFRVHVMTDRRPSLVSLLVAAMIVVAGDATAQAATASPVCWRPRPLAACRSWVITEAAAEFPATSTSAPHLLVGGDGAYYVSDDFETRLAFTLGAMVNRGPTHAFGGTFASTGVDIPGRVEARYRRWLGPDHGIDLSAGVARSKVRGVYDPDELRAAGFTASAGISGAYVGADVRLDLLRASGGRMVHGVYVSGRTGSKAGPITTAVGFVLVLAAWAALIGDDY
jgi:hypothetical protein